MPSNPEQATAGFPSILLKVRPLTREGFAPFGETIQAGDPEQRLVINEGTAERYHALANIDPGPQGRTIVSIFRSQPRELPLLIVTMERHPLASQAFMPLSGRRWLVVVAPAGAPPAAEDLVAFVASGEQGVNYAPGVWHHPLIALDAASDFLVIDRSGPGDNCDETVLPRPARIEALEDQRPAPAPSGA
ncbi:MAG TPA: ureidoglycolate lyase [Burkholderiaceae bacterium]|nr:ureidoglycolate lyase [Burkholderiaceae bacterium]